MCIKVGWGVALYVASVYPQGWLGFVLHAYQGWVGGCMVFMYKMIRIFYLQEHNNFARK